MITVSDDTSRISDLVMLRQVVDVPREQVEALVSMVLECAKEAVPEPAADLRHFTGQIDRVEDEGDSIRTHLILDRTHELEGDNVSASTPLLATQEGRDLAVQLKDLVGRRVVLGVRHELTTGTFKKLIIREVSPAD